jgi:poly-gamma-glutamate capsule biosynthesis protein CapA/YwtB (metallophosphatase superfamily)
MARQGDHGAGRDEADSLRGQDVATTETGGAAAQVITRRELLYAGAGVAATAMVAGCTPIGKQAPAPTATPFKLTRAAMVYVDATVPAAVGRAAVALIGGQAGIASAQAVASLTPAPDLILTYGEPPKGYIAAEIGGSAVTAITHLRVPIDGVSGEQARGLLGGSIADWRVVGAPRSQPVSVFALDGLPLPKGLSLAANAHRVATMDALLAAVRGQAGSLALVPVEYADWTVRNLGIDGVYPAQGRGMAGSPTFAPFALRLAASKALVTAGLNVKALAGALAPALASATATFDMAVAGDIILGRGVNNKMVAYNDYLYPYRKVRDEFMSADWRVANLECTITDLVAPPRDPYTFTFVTAKRAVDGLVYSGIQTVSVANNHADNAGADAFVDMLHTLRAHNIAYCGGGNNLAEARQPAIQTVKGVRVALLAYNEIPPGGPYAGTDSAGIAPVDVASLPHDITAARQQADLVIPFFHWGIEYTKDPTLHQQQVARAAIDAGADMVLGSHPHWVQAIENYKGRLIIYCLGNFIFDQDWSVPTQEGAMLHLYWRGTTLAGVRFVPYRIMDRCQPNIVSPERAVGIFDRMWSGMDMLAHGQYGPEPE